MWKASGPAASCNRRPVNCNLPRIRPPPVLRQSSTLNLLLTSQVILGFRFPHLLASIMWDSQRASLSSVLFQIDPIIDPANEPQIAPSVLGTVPSFWMRWRDPQQHLVLSATLSTAHPTAACKVAGPIRDGANTFTGNPSSDFFRMVAELPWPSVTSKLPLTSPSSHPLSPS